MEIFKHENGGEYLVVTKYEIWQMGDTRNHKFGFADLPSNINSISKSDYNLVYSGEIPTQDNVRLLDQLFYIFNNNRPTDYHGHSLSISDVVVLNGTAYRCQSAGWKNVKLMNHR